MDIQSPYAQPIPTFVFLFFLLLVAGCTQDGAETPRPLAAQTGASPTFTALPPTQTATVTNTPTATPSPTPTNTPTPTPTPTATAQPARLSGNPRGYAEATPDSQQSAVCGVVDFFDFPVDPPDALDVDRGGGDFGRYRERYNGIHAGEDWRGPNGRSLGSPVYAIGHGRVIYAHPNGWGVDQGTVIVRHVLPDGSRILSFYGHLDPPSVNLRYGECVARGQQIAEIGDPRGRPHLHWEIRSHTPDDPGPGYWSVDPTLAGWFPPSLTVWESRYDVSPGTQWTRPPASGAFDGTQAIGFPAGELLILLEEGRLQGIGSGDGRLRWTQPDPPTPTPQPEATPDPTRIAWEVEAAAPVSAALDEVAPVLYAVDRRRRMEAYATAEEAASPLWEPLWQAELPITGSPTLYPLPGGGVLAIGRSEMVALDAEGQQRWEQTFEGTPGPAVRAGEQIYFPVERGEPTLWSVSADGATAWSGLPEGSPRSHTGNPLWFYAREAIYRLDPATEGAEQVLALPPAGFGAAAHGEGDAVALPDGGLLVAHHDLDDHRLLRLDSEGALLWERSYRRLGDGEAHLLLLQGQPFLALVEAGETMLVTLFAVSPEDGALVRIFNGGTRTGRTQDTWLLAAPGGLLLNIGGGHLVSLDPVAAVEALAPSP